MQYLLSETVFDSKFGIPFFAMIAVFLMSSLYPLGRRMPFSRMIAASSLLIIPLWIWYESLLPRHMNIRVDLFIIGPIAIVSAILLIRRLSWLLTDKPNAKHEVRQ